VEEQETSLPRGCGVDRKVGGSEKDAGLKTRHYTNSKKSWRRRRWAQQRERDRMKGRAIGWIATRTWERVAWVSITVKDQYLVGIIRMRRAEVERLKGVGGNLPVWW